jgi:hypothetical protein
MFICRICGQSFEKKQQLGGHLGGFHRREEISRNLTKEKSIFIKTCLKCGKDFTVIRKIENNIVLPMSDERVSCSRKCANSHIQTKEQNEKRSEANKGREPPNKISSPIISFCRKCNKVIKNSSSGFCKNCLSSSIEWRKKISDSTKGKCGGYRKNSNFGKGAYYKNDWYDSPFEIEIAKFLEKNEISFERNTNRFYFDWEGRKTYYIPDFYLPSKKVFLEVKGYWHRPRERYEKCISENNLKWICLEYKEWKKDSNILLQKLGSII